MDTMKYTIVYLGEIIEGFSTDQATDFLVEQFGADRGTAQKIIRSKRAILKKNLDLKTAEQYQATFADFGIRVKVEPSEFAGNKTGKAYRDASAIPPNTAQRLRRPDEMQPTRPETKGPLPARPHVTPFEFHGNGTEYFKIWLANILLTLITFGIYSPWAKVRRKQYFYGNTKINGASFQYLADPVKILKGRLVVFGVFIVYSIVGELFPIAGVLFGIAFAIALPWIVVRSLIFNARNSSFRNIRFGFTGSVWDAAKAFVFWPMAAVATLGILMPYVYYKQRRFVVENSRYGTTSFAFNAQPGDYYKIFLILTLTVLAAIGLAVLVGFLFRPISAIIIGVMYLYAFAFIATKTSNLLYNNTRLTSHSFIADMDVVQYAIIVVTNTLATALTLGIFHPWAVVRALRYKLAHLAFVPDGDIDHFINAEQQQTSAFGDEMSDFMDLDFGL
ncbi:MAG: DUF898 domain-containing protein [Desulfobacteraceae bacterium]|nr:DUF898 domain-containing protein [Desulfobacteraceae bacterium]